MYCELYSCLVEPALLAQVELHGIILSGGPASVYDPESPHVHPEVWQLIKDRKVPVLGICYGMQEITHVFGGEVSKGTVREFGKAMVHKVAAADALGAELFAGLESPEGFQMWMSHGDKVTKLPEGFAPVAATDACAA